jgi:integral membrane sensor domain MASE1
VVVGFASLAFDALVLRGVPTGAGMALALLTTIESAAIAAFIHRRCGDEFSFDRVSHALTFSVATFAAPAVTALLGAAAVNPTQAPFVSGWFAWWLGHALGVLVTSPWVLTLPAARSHSRVFWTSGRVVEACVAFGGLLAVSLVVLGGFFDNIGLVPAYVLPFLLWPAMRFGPAGSALGVFVVGLIGMWSTAHGSGPYAQLAAAGGNVAIRAQGAMGMTALSVLLLASMVAERRNALRERAQLVEDLQQALVEIKTLRGLIPICAWCHKVRDDAGFWQRLETYLGEKTDATFSHSICPSCAERQHEAAATTSAPGQAWKI